jgi:hypothetical protein
MAAAQALRERGNGCFGRRQYEEARMRNAPRVHVLLVAAPADA